MTRAIIVLTLTMMFAAPPSRAASQPRVATDPISGTWTQEDSAGARLDLKYDGAKAITGTVATPQGPAPIKTGVFNPKTGAFRLEGDAKEEGGGTKPYVIAGSIKSGLATGTWQFGDAKGEFKMSRKTPAGRSGKTQ